MLDEDYSKQLDAIKQSIPWSIQLPESMSRFFEYSGECAISHNEERRFMRIRARMHAIGFFDLTISSVDRDRVPFGVYTADFSRTGCSFISHFQLFPTEEVRLILPKFWLQLQVVRCRKLGDNCFENGAVLISRNPASEKAFEGIPVPALAN